MIPFFFHAKHATRRVRNDPPCEKTNKKFELPVSPDLLPPSAALPTLDTMALAAGGSSVPRLRDREAFELPVRSLKPWPLLKSLLSNLLIEPRLFPVRLGFRVWPTFKACLLYTSPSPRDS